MTKFRHSKPNSKPHISKDKLASKVRTFTPWSIGSLLNKSINGGLLRGVPVVSKSPSTGLPYILTAFQRLYSNETKGKQEDQNKKQCFAHTEMKYYMANNLLPLVMIEARSKRNPSTCISVTQYLSHRNRP